MSYRPGEIAKDLGISANTLRLWSTHFADHLSPSAQAARTEKGGAAQRRYTDEDRAVLLRAKALLAQNKTYEEVNDLLSQPPSDEEQATVVALPEPQAESNALVVLTRHMSALEEYVKQSEAQNERLVAEMGSLRQEFAELNANLVRIAELAAKPAPKPRFRFNWLNRLLTWES